MLFRSPPPPSIRSSVLCRTNWWFTDPGSTVNPMAVEPVVGLMVDSDRAPALKLNWMLAGVSRASNTSSRGNRDREPADWRVAKNELAGRPMKRFSAANPSALSLLHIIRYYNLSFDPSICNAAYDPVSGNSEGFIRQNNLIIRLLSSRRTNLSSRSACQKK